MVSNNNQIEEIKNRLDIVQVVEKYVKLKKAGKNYSGNCPFHNEKTPSFMVSPEIQRYKCFGCGESGDIFNFIQEIENLDFPEALEKLAKEAGVEIKKTAPNTRYTRLEEINYIATKYYYKQLKASKEAQEYIKERGFDDTSIKTFGIGYAPKRQKLREELNKVGFNNKKELLDSGLFVEKDSQIKDKFVNRIMFPIRSSRGKVIAFTARNMPDSDWGPKYLNSPETPLFKKKNNLYGQYESKQDVRKEDLAIICEGSTDVISAHQKKHKNIVAPLGTGLTREQLENLSRLTKNILFFFDNDDAGFKALVRGFKIASELNLYAYATNADPHKDIDELLQKDPKLMKQKIDSKTSAFVFILSQLLNENDLSKLQDLKTVRNSVEELLEHVKDPSLRSFYIKKANKITKTNLIKPERGSTHTRTPSHKTQHTETKYNKAEKEFVQLLLLSPSVSQETLPPEKHLKDKGLRSIYREIKSGEWATKKDLHKNLQGNSSTKKLFEDLIFRTSELPQEKAEIEKELIALEKLLEKQHLRGKQKDLTVKIAIAEENNRPKESERLLKELIEINKLLQEKTNG